MDSAFGTGSERNAKPIVLQRRLPLPARPSRRAGENVGPADVVATADFLPGSRWVVPVSSQLQVGTEEIGNFLHLVPGDEVQRGGILAQVPGSPERAARAPVKGVIERFSPMTGHVIMRGTAEDKPIPVVCDARKKLGCQGSRLGKMLCVQAGDFVRWGQLLGGRYPGPMLFAPVSGKLVEVNLKKGELVLIPAQASLQLMAGIWGTVSRVTPYGCDIQSEAAVLPGQFRLGGEAFGLLQAVPAVEGSIVKAEQITTNMKGRVVALQSELSGEVFFRARMVGVRALIAGGIRLVELLKATGIKDPSAVLYAHLPDITVLLTSGFGAHEMGLQLFSWLCLHEGKQVFISGGRPEALLFP